MSCKFDVIGSRARRLDAVDKATGKALYAEDLRFPDALHGALLQSPLPHAKVLNIDVSRALKLPGVKDVITAKDVPSTRYGVSPARYDENLFAIDRVRYVGDEVAAVAAVDLETALEAIELIQVDYEPLPHVLTVEEALA